MTSVLPLRDRIDHWIENQIGDEMLVPSNSEFRRTLRVSREFQRSTRLPFSSGHMKLAAAENVTAENLPDVLRRVLHKPMKKWLEGRYSDLVTHLGGISLPEGQGSSPELVGVLANVLDVHLVEFTVVLAGKGWIFFAEKPLVADVRGEDMMFEGDLGDFVAATAMLSIVPTVPA